MYYVMRASAPSLHRESTDSLITHTMTSIYDVVANHVVMHAYMHTTLPIYYVNQTLN